MPPNETCVCEEDWTRISDGICGRCFKTKSQEFFKNLESGKLCLPNPHLNGLYCDQLKLSHLGIYDTPSNLVRRFGDVKFVCMGGTSSRMREFAEMLQKDLGTLLGLDPSAVLEDITGKAERYSMFKVGPVLAVNHGIGVPSLSVALTEVLKLLHHAEAKDPIFFRIGTSGGIGLKPGTLVITKKAVDGMFRDYLEFPVLGKPQKFPAAFDQNLLHELEAEVLPHEDWDTVHGTTVCTPDYFEGQGRLDGAFCTYSEEDKMAYLHTLADKGVANIEMETVGFGSLTYRAGVRAAAVCVTLLDRLQGDQARDPPEVIHDYTMRPLILVSRFIKRQVLAMPSA